MLIKRLRIKNGQARGLPLLQIKDKGCARAYDVDERKKFLLGVSFFSKTGTIEEWEVEEI